MRCDKLFQRRRQSTTSSITKLRYTTAKTFDEDGRTAWRQRHGSDGQVEDNDEGYCGVVWQSQQRPTRHDNCDCAKCRCRPKPEGDQSSSTASVLYVTKPPLYWHPDHTRCRHLHYLPPCQPAIIAISVGINLARNRETNGGLHIHNERWARTTENVSSASVSSRHHGAIQILLLIFFRPSVYYYYYEFVRFSTRKVLYDNAKQQIAKRILSF